MKVMTFSEFRKLTGENMRENTPIKVTVDGVEQFLVTDADEIIVVGDLHPRVRNKLKALERRARIGMPKDTKVEAKDIPKAKLSEA